MVHFRKFEFSKKYTIVFNIPENFIKSQQAEKYFLAFIHLLRTFHVFYKYIISSIRLLKMFSLPLNFEFPAIFTCRQAGKNHGDFKFSGR